MVTPPRATAASETAPAAANANLSPREAERPSSGRPTGWMRKPPPSGPAMPSAAVGRKPCAGAGTYPNGRRSPRLTPKAPEVSGTEPPPRNPPPGRRRAAAVQVTSPGETLEAGQEARRGRGRGRLREHVLQRALGVRLRLAPGAGGQVRQDPLTRLVTELSVHQGGEPVSQVLLREVRLLHRFRS
ncbi:hypothetical protein GCM10017687_56520 [Streptomyces echinatus]